MIAPGRARLTLVAIDEGWANVRAAPLRSALAALTAAAITAAVIVFSVTQVSGIEHRYRSGVRNGRFVLVAHAITREGLDAGRCDALRSVPGVRNAGAVVSSSTVYPQAAPQRPYELLRVTPGLLGVWFPGHASPSHPGLVVGHAAAHELGLVRGAALRTASAPSGNGQAGLDRSSIQRRTVASVLAPSERDPEVDRMVFDTVAPVGRTSTCLVDPDPSSRVAVEAAMVGWFGADQPASVTPLLDERAGGRMPETELAERASAWSWLIGAGALGSLTAVLWYGRRDEFALYRLLGLGRDEIAVMLVTEASLTLLVPALIAVGATVGWAVPALVADASTSLGPAVVAPLTTADLASFVLALALVPPLGTAVVCWRSTVDALKGF